MNRSFRAARRLATAVVGSSLVLAGVAATPAVAGGPSLKLSSTSAVSNGKAHTIGVYGTGCRYWSDKWGQEVVGQVDIAITGSRLWAWAYNISPAFASGFAGSITLPADAPVDTYSVSARCHNRPSDPAYSFDYPALPFTLSPLVVPPHPGSEY